MLRAINEIVGYTLLAQDGGIGRCHDFLFDDRSWVVRYMVAKTAKWLPGRKVIVSPGFLSQPDWVKGHLPLRLTREQIEQSPGLDEHAPISRQYEISYHQYYALPFYWISRTSWEAYPDPAVAIPPTPAQPVSKGESGTKEGHHLRSVKEVSGYHIAATDGEVGHVDDFLVDDTTWALRYLVVDTRNWLPGRKVLISPQWLKSIHWVDEKVYVDLETEAIKNSPEFDPSQAVDHQYEIELCDYYGRQYR